MNKNKFKLFTVSLFLIILVSCTSMPSVSNSILNEKNYEVDTNHLFFDFSNIQKDWIVLKNNTNIEIDVTYLAIEENATIALDNEWFYVGTFHSKLFNDTKLEDRNRGKCVIETGNGKVKSYSISYLKNGIVVTILDFMEVPVELIDKQLNAWAINELNGTFNESFAKEEKYTAELRFSYNSDLNTLNLEDRYYQNPILEEDMCSTFLNKHPEIKQQEDLTEKLYTFIFTKSDNSYFSLSDIEGLDYDELKQIAEKNKTHIKYGSNYYKKVEGITEKKVFPLSIRDRNFINNNPYGFKKDRYYYPEENFGYVLQWINENSCLYDFAPDTIYTQGQGLSLVTFDSSISNYPFEKNILYHYEGVYTYTTSAGGSKSVPKFRIIFSENEKEKTTGTEVVTEFISFNNRNFKRNNPYGFSKNSKYFEDEYSIKGKVLQWLDNGCLYDFSGGIPDITWSCLVYLVLPESQRNLFFDEDYTHYYTYEGVFTYETVNYMANTVPKFKVNFEKK